MKMGFHQRMLCITLVLLISLFMLPAGAVSAEESEAYKRTVMFYCVASILESNGGFATKSLKQIMDAEYNDDLDFIAVTGGKPIAGFCQRIILKVRIKWTPSTISSGR